MIAPRIDQEIDPQTAFIGRSRHITPNRPPTAPSHSDPTDRLSGAIPPWFSFVCQPHRIPMSSSRPDRSRKPYNRPPQFNKSTCPLPSAPADAALKLWVLERTTHMPIVPTSLGYTLPSLRESSFCLTSPSLDAHYAPQDATTRMRGKPESTASPDLRAPTPKHRRISGTGTSSIRMASSLSSPNLRRMPVPTPRNPGGWTMRSRTWASPPRMEPTLD